MTSTAVPPKVDTKHGSYAAMEDRWKRARDSVEGQDAIKAGGTSYLPRPYGFDDAQYKALLQRALWYDAPARTIDALVGVVLSSAATIELTKDTATQDDLAKQSGMDGSSFAELLHECLSVSLTTSRIGLLVDAPESDPALALVATYEAEDIWNWRTDDTGRPVLVVLHEAGEELQGEFGGKPIERLRVLRLAAGVYTQQVYTRTETSVDWAAGEVITPKKRGGATWDEIPFEVCNARHTGLPIERPILMGLFDLAVSWYQNSADLEHGRHWCGCPTAVAVGFPDLDATGQPVTLAVGGSNVWRTSVTGASAEYLEFTGAGLGHLQTGMTEKQNGMAAIGGRMLEQPKAGVESAEALQLRAAGEKSALARVAETVGAALQRVMGWVCEWRKPGSGDAVVVELAQDLGAPAMDPTMMTALMAQVQAGLISWNTYFEKMRQGRVIAADVTAEEEAARIVLGPPGGPAAGGLPEDEDADARASDDGMPPKPGEDEDEEDEEDEEQQEKPLKPAKGKEPKP